MRFSDYWQEQQDDSAPELSGSNCAAGFANFHRNIQSIRQAYEFNPRRLRRVQKNQAEKHQTARSRREASAWFRTIAW